MNNIYHYISLSTEDAEQYMGELDSQLLDVSGDDVELMALPSMAPLALALEWVGLEVVHLHHHQQIRHHQSVHHH